MQCELCGAEIKGQPKRVRIEGAELQVCMQCARYGREVQQARTPPTARKPLQGSTVPRLSPRPRKDVFDLIKGDLIEGYNERIRLARMAKGWSQKDLAMAIKQRELLIKKIEKGDLTPEDTVRKKIEQVLEISLLDIRPEETNVKKKGQVTTTLGDLISLKKSEK
ncbi:MAG: multiprotein bridging factor aMBF1 [Methanomicrobiales archaeon]|nr:multiprotein bridging factor aMBF1 [Methanomicrobiales archaeon]